MSAAKKRKRPSRRRVFWAWRAHLDSGFGGYLFTKLAGSGMGYPESIRALTPRPRQLRA